MNPRLQGVAIRGVPIRMMDELKGFVQRNEVDIAVLTIPKEKAIEVANMLVENGVRAIWEFRSYRSESSGEYHCGECPLVRKSDAAVL